MVASYHDILAMEKEEVQNLENNGLNKAQIIANSKAKVTNNITYMRGLQFVGVRDSFLSLIETDTIHQKFR